MKRLAPVGIGALFLGFGSLYVWSKFDRTAAYSAICDAGLPNLSRPAEVKADDLGCVVLAPKAVYDGVLITGFEASNFSSANFPRNSGSFFERDDLRAWFNCPATGCGNALRKQLDNRYLDSCILDELDGIGFASIRVEGWVTLSADRFGHLGAYPKEFYASKILKVGPPPKSIIDRWIAGYRRAELCDDQ
ncbi:hypothetical protein [Tsuneonella dongtanensis]|uniref:hypothetical protein n=1 Tax=Tsuneonella dongtanensis TaxID=692370 RepID=UPI0012EEDFBC|nr:hypothetical protein [Tsuneonella dongtanensis]